MRVRFSSPALSDAMHLQKDRTGSGPQRGLLVSGPSTGPLSPSFQLVMRARFWSPAPQQHSWWFLERPRRFLRSHVLRFRARYWLLLTALRLIGASTGAVGEEVVVFYDEEFARSTFSGQRRALSSRRGSVRPTRLRTSRRRQPPRRRRLPGQEMPTPGFLLYSPD